MVGFERCPVCGGEVVQKKVEKLLRGGKNVAAVKVKADVCLHCGERMYSKETVGRFQEIRSKLAHRRLSGFKPMGKAYTAAG